MATTIAIAIAIAIAITIATAKIPFRGGCKVKSGLRIGLCNGARCSRVENERDALGPWYRVCMVQKLAHCTSRRTLLQSIDSLSFDCAIISYRRKGERNVTPT
ncbi:MAG: hypothetical protein J3R72DRAFT_438151 [Linnemannia gamsii]|nr:MAG: hypothetical protein J3R72DRAFT_438151 [Linnemannia gamsii]